MFVGIGWLDPGAEQRWRRRQIDCLEAAVQSALPRITEAMKLFRSWAAGKGLFASETDYVARTPQRETLRFSRSGDPTIERLYRTHWVSPELSDKKRERLAEKASRAPELVVIQPLNREWTCNRCGGTGGLLVMENAGPACLRCVGLDDLELLPAGDALLTRRARRKAQIRRRRAVQQEPPPLRATGASGRAAGVGGRASRIGVRVGRHPRNYSKAPRSPPLTLPLRGSLPLPRAWRGAG